MVSFSRETVVGLECAFMVGSSDFSCNRIRGCGRMSGSQNTFGHRRRDTGAED